MLPVFVSSHRRAPSPTSPRLIELVDTLRGQGFLTLRAQATMLGVPAGALRNYLSGFPMPADVAREIEWVMGLQTGWLDDAPASDAAVM